MTETFSYTTCPECSTRALNADVCAGCGFRFDSDEAGEGITLSLVFAAEDCPNCRVPHPAGLCHRCGTAVPESTEPGEAAVARQRALTPLLSRAQEAAIGFGRMPAPNVLVTSQQYVTAMKDAGVFDAVRELVDLAVGFETLDFSDEGAIGGASRRAIERFVGHLERLLDETRMFAWFDVPGGFDGCRSAMIDVGAHAADLACEVLGALVAATFSEAHERIANVQALLASVPALERFDVALESAGDPLADDLDERVSLALGVQGRYTDELGALDLGRIFAVAREHGEPFGVMAAGSRRFFAHMLSQAPDRLGPEAAVLAMAAVPLSALERPLPGHRTAMLTYRLLARSYDNDPERVVQLIKRTVGHSDRVLSAAIRIQRDWRRLAHDPAIEVHDVMTAALQTYKRLAETAYRNDAGLVLGLIRLSIGRRADDRLPMVGALGRELAGLKRHEPDLVDLLTAAVDVDVRNAEAHEDFSIERDGCLYVGERVVLPEELEEISERLIGCIAGVDAGVMCFAYDRQIQPEIVSEAWGERTPAAKDAVAGMMFSAYGVELQGVDVFEDALVFCVQPAEGEALFTDPPVLRFLPLVAGLTHQYREAGIFRMDDQHGTTVLEVSRESLLAYTTATPEMSDLAIVLAVVDASVRSGFKREQAYRELLAVWLLVIINSAGDAWSGAGADPRLLRQVARRLRYATRFAGPRRRDLDPSTARVVQTIRAARDWLVAGVNGDAVALNRASDALERLAEWAENQERKVILVGS